MTIRRTPQLRAIYREEIDAVATGKVVREARLAQNLTQKRIAQEIGISQAYLCDLEMGRRQWSEEMLTKVRGVLEKVTKE